MCMLQKCIMTVSLASKPVPVYLEFWYRLGLFYLMFETSYCFQGVAVS